MEEGSLSSLSWMVVGGSGYGEGEGEGGGRGELSRRGLSWAIVDGGQFSLVKGMSLDLVVVVVEGKAD